MRFATSAAARQGRTDQLRRDRAIAPMLRVAFPRVQQLRIELTFTAPSSSVPAPQSHVLYPPAAAFFEYPCPWSDCDGQFNLGGAVHTVLNFHFMGVSDHFALRTGIALVYFFIVVPTQELIFRGIIQSGLEQMLPKRWLAIFGSSLIFSAIHSLYSAYFSLAAFGLGLYLGWLYSRTRTILSPTLAHAIIAWWVFYILDLQDLFIKGMMGSH